MARLSEDERFASLISALELVAAEPARQLAMWPELRAIAAAIQRGDPAGELIDEALVREGVLSPELGLQVQRIDALFDQLLTRGELNAAALRGSPEWQRMRALAREALTLLGLPPRTRATGPRKTRRRPT